MANKIWDGTTPLFDPTQYEEQSRFLFPTPQRTVAPSPAVIQATRDVMADPAAVQRQARQAGVEADAQAALDILIQKDLERQALARKQEEYRQDIEKRRQESIARGERSVLVPTFDEWVAEQNGDTFGLGKKVMKTLSMASEIPAMGLTTLADIPKAIEQGRAPMGYQGRTLGNMESTFQSNQQENRDSEVAQAEAVAAKDVLKNQTPKNQAILQSGDKPLVTTESQALANQDTGFRENDPNTWIPGLVNTVNQTIDLAKTMAKGVPEYMAGNETANTQALTDFAYQSAATAPVSMAGGATVMGLGKVASAALRVKMASVANKARMFADDAKVLKKEADMLRKNGDIVGAIKREEAIKEKVKAANDLYNEIRVQSNLKPMALESAGAVAEEAGQGLVESAVAGAQGQGSQAEVSGQASNIVQELSLEAPGMVKHLPRIQAYLSVNPGVTRKEFVERVLPKLVQDPQALQDAKKHPRVTELMMALRDVNLPSKTEVTVNPSRKVLGENAPMEGYGSDYAGSEVLGESNKGIIALHGGAKGGTVAEEAAHAWQSAGKRAKELADTMVGSDLVTPEIQKLADSYTEHQSMAEEAANRVKTLPKGSRAHVLLSNAFGRDISESPLTGDEIMARIILVENGWKSADPAEDLLAKIARTSGTKVSLAESLGKNFKKGKLSKGEEALSSNEMRLSPEEVKDLVRQKQELIDQKKSGKSAPVYQDFETSDQAIPEKRGFAIPLTSEDIKEPTPFEYWKWYGGLSNIERANVDAEHAGRDLPYPHAPTPRLLPGAMNYPNGKGAGAVSATEADFEKWYAGLTDKERANVDAVNQGELVPFPNAGVRPLRPPQPAKTNQGGEGIPSTTPNLQTVVNVGSPETSQDATRRFSLKKTKASQEQEQKNPRKAIVRGLKTLMAKQGKLSSDFDLMLAVDSMKEANRLSFQAAVEQWMDEDPTLFKSAGISKPEKGADYQDLIYRVRDWVNTKGYDEADFRNPEKWDHTMMMRHADRAPFEHGNMVPMEAQDLAGREWQVMGDRVEFVRNPKGTVSAFKVESRGGVTTKEKLTTFEPQEKVWTDENTQESQNYPDIPDEAYMNDRFFQDEETLEPEYEGLRPMPEDYRADVGAKGLAEEHLKIVKKVSEDIAKAAPKSEGGEFVPAKPLDASEKATLLRPGPIYPGYVEDRYGAGRFFRDMSMLLAKKAADQHVFVNAVEKQNPGAAKQSVYSRARRMPSIVDYRIVKELNPTIKEMVEKIAKAGLKWDEAETYAYALAAVERNSVKGDSEASGQSTMDALQSMASIANTTAKKEALVHVFGSIDASGKVTHRGIFQKINDAKLDACVEAGVLEPATAAYLKEKYSVYTAMKSMQAVERMNPGKRTLTQARLHVGGILKRLGVKYGERMINEAKTLIDNDYKLDAAPEYSGGEVDMSVKDSGLRKAEGRATLADYPVSWAIRDAVNAISKAERAKVQQLFLDFVQNTGSDPRFISVEPGLKQDYDFDQNKMVWKDDQGNIVDKPYEAEKNNEMVVMKNNKSYKLTANPNNLDAMMSLRSIKQADMVKLGVFFKILAAANNFLSGMLTRWNPVFPATNTPKDIQNAATHLAIRYGKETARKFIAELGPSFKESFRGQYGKGSDLYEKFRKHGGDIAFMSDVDVEQIAKKYAKEVDNIQRGKKFDHKGILGAFEFTNNVTDKAVRLAVFSAIAKSMPKNLSESEQAKYLDDAALAARDATVDFNAKGDWTPYISSIFLFANPGIQQFYNVAKNFENVDYRRRAAITYSTAFMFGTAIALYNRMKGDDEETGNNRWDDVPAFQKASTITILKNKAEDKSISGFKIPLMYGSAGFFYAMGQAAEAIAMSDNPKKLENTLAMSLAAANSAMPVQGLMPTMVTPFWELGTNRNYMDMPIVPESGFSTYEKPNFTKYYRTTPEGLKKAAEVLNRVSGGGGEFDKPGVINVSPEHLNYAMQFALGALYGEGSRAIRFAKEVQRVANGEEPDKGIQSKDIPILSKYTMTDPEDRAVRSAKSSQDDLERIQAQMNEIAKTEGMEKAIQFQEKNFAQLAFLAGFSELSKAKGSATKASARGYLFNISPSMEEKVVENRSRMAKTWNNSKKYLLPLNDSLARIDSLNITQRKKDKMKEKVKEKILQKISENLVSYED